MNKEEFKQYIEKIQDRVEFRNFAGILRINDMEGASIFDKVMRYMLEYCSVSENGNVVRTLKYDRFVKFMDSCLSDSKDGFTLSDNGTADLNHQNFLWQANVGKNSLGNFCEGWMIFPDGSKYLSKRTLGMNQCHLDIWPITSMYAPIIGSQIAKKLDVTSAEYFIGTYDMKGRDYSRDRILSSNILAENEELIPLGKEENIQWKGNYISDTINLFKNKLRDRKYPDEEIEALELEFLKQEFIAKLIGLRDQKPDNSPIIISVDDEGKKHVRMSPMMDFDYSFQYAVNKGRLPVRKCQNNMIDVSSFVLQYKDNRELFEFIKNSVEKFDMDEIFRSIYEEKGMQEFKNELNYEYMIGYAGFVNNNMDKK